MSTDLQRKASRINGAKSRGPVTPEGKLICFTTGLKHGLLAEAVVIDGESADQLAAISEAYHTEFGPVTQAEIHHVETMVICRWRLLRVWELESATFNHEIRQLFPTPEYKTSRTHAALALRSLVDRSGCLDLLNRYETRFMRAFIRSHQCLLKLQTRRMRNAGTNDSPPKKPMTIDTHAEELK